MNLLLLSSEDFITPTKVQLRDRRMDHLLSVIGAESGQELRVGLLNGLVGSAIVDSIGTECVTLTVNLHHPPPKPLPLTLVLALPRPKVLRRILQHVATLGVKKLILLNSYRVEKSYWQSPLLKEVAIREDLLLGLEQAGDTKLPEVVKEPLFRPFVEDRLPDLCIDKRALVAHPRNCRRKPQVQDCETVLVVGPEGGFIDYEIEKLKQAGCDPIQLGARILRVETAIPVLVSRLFPIF